MAAGKAQGKPPGRTDSAGFREDFPVIWLQAGHVIAFTLPLHETVDQQWRNGELQRVNEDGSPFEGDQYDLAGMYDLPPEDPPAGPPDRAPARPADNAPLKAWQEYAVAVGACTAEEAVAMTRPDLISKCTPPEMKSAGA
jgi:hypothetical protein